MRQVWVVVLLCILLFSIPPFIISYYNNCNYSALGSLGDFLGGVLGPIIGIVNIGLLFYITKLVSNLDNKRQEYGIKVEVYSKIHGVLDEFYKEITEIGYKRLFNIYCEFTSLKDSYSFLFLALEGDSYKAIIKNMENIIRMREKSDEEQKTILETGEFKRLENEFVVTRKELTKMLKKDLTRDR
jgi:hypothetical protein